MEETLNELAISISSTGKNAKKKKKRPLIPFRDHKFQITHVAEHFRILRTNFYNLERKDPRFIPSLTEAGSRLRREYTWDQVWIVAQKYGRKPKVLNKVKTFCNIKGGVGKSTLSSQFAMFACLQGLKVLAIDLDPQAHLSLSFGKQFVDNAKPHIAHHWFNTPPLPLNQIIQMVTPNLGLIPANLTLSSLELMLFTQNARESYLKDLIDSIKDDWDLIIIDTTPSESIVNTNAILASDELCIPCKTDFLSVDGMSHLFDVIAKLVAKFKIRPSVKVIPNLYDVRDGLSQESLGALNKFYGQYLTKNIVPKNIDIAECQKREQAIWQFNRTSSGYKSIKALSLELITGEQQHDDTDETQI